MLRWHYRNEFCLLVTVFLFVNVNKIQYGGYITEPSGWICQIVVDAFLFLSAFTLSLYLLILYLHVCGAWLLTAPDHIEGLSPSPLIYSSKNTLVSRTIDESTSKSSCMIILSQTQALCNKSGSRQMHAPHALTMHIKDVNSSRRSWRVGFNNVVMLISLGKTQCLIIQVQGKCCHAQWRSQPISRPGRV